MNSIAASLAFLLPALLMGCSSPAANPPPNPAPPLAATQPAPVPSPLDTHRQHALISAAGKGQLEIVERLLASGASARRVKGEHYGPLHAAALEADRTNLQNCQDVIKTLLKHGAALDEFDSDGQTALQSAILLGHKEDMALFLLKLGADPRIKTNRGRSSFHMVCMNPQPQIARLLLDAGADPFQEDSAGNTPVSMVRHNMGEAAEEILNIIIDKFLPGMVQQLDDEDFARRDSADKDLRTLGPAALPMLRESLKNPASPEVQTRLSAIIRSFGA